jgi:hypothetical protein
MPALHNAETGSILNIPREIQMPKPLFGDTTNKTVPGVEGDCNLDANGGVGVKGDCKADGGTGVWGVCDTGHGVHGDSKTSRGVVGTSVGFHGVFGKSITNVGVAGESDAMFGVLGVCNGPTPAGGGTAAGVMGDNRAGGGYGVWGACATGHGVHGDSTTSRGVVGLSQKFHGVYGHSVENVGVAGESDSMWGVLGVCKNPGGVGVVGENVGGDGVVGKGRRGVVGESDAYQGVYGHSKTNAGVVGESDEGDGVFGVSKKATSAGVSGHNTAGGLAGFFEGNVAVTGDIQLTNADFAEDFYIGGVDKADPGTVMVLGDEGSLFESQKAYDKRVAGVISGAGDYKPAIVLDKRHLLGNRQSIALMGKVFCKVDAQFGAIEVGDLLTTSPTPGHAMKTDDPFKAFGTVIGKALRPLTEGQGLIPILIALQ